MPEPTVPRVGDTIGRYSLERALGEGGMGTVFLARHAVTGRRVALKWTGSEDKVLRARTLREARAMGRLSHPNVVGVLDAGEVDGGVFTVMDYVDGQNLRDYAYQKVLSPAEALDLLLPAMSGVAAAHQAGILHRDLKPENLFVCLDEHGLPFDTKVLDFGVAKNIASAETTLTASGTIIGTPKYMAPEQILNGDDIDARMDVYAMGVILYELLCGRVPYKNSGLKTLVVEILAGKLPHLREQRADLPPALCDAVMHALSTERDERYATIAEFAQAVEPFAGRRRFEPPRQIHTPDHTLDDPDFTAAKEVMRAARTATGRSAATAPTERAPTPISLPAPSAVTKPRVRRPAVQSATEAPQVPSAEFNVERVVSEVTTLPRSRTPLLLALGVALLLVLAVSLALRGRPPESAGTSPSATVQGAQPTPVHPPAGPTPSAAQAEPPVATKPQAVIPEVALPAAAPSPERETEPAPRPEPRRRAGASASSQTLGQPPTPAPSTPVAADKTVKVRGGTLTAKDF